MDGLTDALRIEVPPATRARSPPSPYRVLAFTLDCGDRPLAALLASRLTRPSCSRPPAAWRAFAQIAIALDVC